MKKFQKILAKFLLGVMILESFGLGNMAIDAQESETNNSSVSEILTTTEENTQSEAAENSDSQNDESIENKEVTEGSAGASGDASIQSADAIVGIATRSAGETRATTSANAGNARVLENIRILVERRNEDGTEKLEYLTGEPIEAFAGFTISDISSDLRNTKLRLRIPKKNVQIGTIGSFNRINPVRSDNDIDYVATWNFDNVTGGQFADVPFTFSMIQPQTPNGFVVPVTAEFLNENNEVIGTTTKNFVAKTTFSNPTTFKWNGEMDGNNRRLVREGDKEVYMANLNGKE